MEHAEQIFARLIEQRLKALNTNAFAFEKQHGLPPDALRSVLRGIKKSGTGLNKAQQICDALGLEFYIGPPREGGPVEQVIIDSRTFVHIPHHQTPPATDNTPRPEETAPPLAFRRSWLADLGVATANAVLARAADDSMAPSIHAGDLLLIDRAKKKVPLPGRSPKDRRPAPIYAILDAGAVHIKRLERPEPGILILRSDNLSYRTEVLTGPGIDTLDIIGKVMWWGHANSA